MSGIEEEEGEKMLAKCWKHALRPIEWAMRWYCLSRICVACSSKGDLLTHEGLCVHRWLHVACCGLKVLMRPSAKEAASKCWPKSKQSLIRCQNKVNFGVGKQEVAR